MLNRVSAWYRSTFGYASTGAALLWLALPPCDLWPLAWLAPVWWVLLIRQRELPGPRPYRALWLAGFLFWLGALHWLRLPHWATSFGWLALAFYQAFYLPVFVGLGRMAVHRWRVPTILAAPCIWTGLELARAHLLTGITMANLGHTQFHWIELIQLSDLVGAYGVSFVVMFAAACFARIVPCDDHRWAFWPLAPAIGLVAAAVMYGHWRMAEGPPAQSDAAPGIRIALIQGCIDTQMKSDPSMNSDIFKQYFGLSRAAIDEYGKVDLVVWPETMFREPLYTYDANATMPEGFKGTPAEFDRRLKATAAESRQLLGLTAKTLGVPMILGVDRRHFDAGGLRYFNSAVLVGPDGKLLGQYDKMHRVLFGEYVPFAEYIPWLQRLTPLPISLAAGAEPAAFDLGGLKIAPNICYETVLPQVIRRQVNGLRAKGIEPDVLVNLSNDGWFWGSSELDMHLICGVFRAVECRKPLLIAANTGFSAWIDGDGRIRSQGPRRQTGTILAEPQIDPRRSWYLVYGDVPAGVCQTLCIVLAVAGCWERFRRRGPCTQAERV